MVIPMIYKKTKPVFPTEAAIINDFVLLRSAKIREDQKHNSPGYLQAITCGTSNISAKL